MTDREQSQQLVHDALARQARANLGLPKDETAWTYDQRVACIRHLALATPLLWFLLPERKTAVHSPDMKTLDQPKKTGRSHKKFIAKKTAVRSANKKTFPHHKPGTPVAGFLKGAIKMPKIYDPADWES